MLYARVGGAWQPVGFSSTDRWNTAWGVVATGSFNIADGAAVAASTTITNPLSFVGVAGRQYRINGVIRAITQNTGVTTFSTQNIILFMDGGGVTDRYLPLGPNQAQTNGQYTNWSTSWLFQGDGSSHTWTLRTGSGPTTLMYAANGLFYIEDIGPVAGAPSIPNPTPAWITLPLLNGWAASDAPRTPKYRMVGDMVQLRGATVSPSSNAVIAQLPLGYRPPMIVSDTAAYWHGGYDFATVGINPDGTITAGMVTYAWGGEVALNGIQFSVTS